ncbi:resolvase-like protein [Brevibacterium sanguinis]|uniref:Resolvase-like protein n=2 Tax=Brevibacterium TaxID=1696 RepID=A0A366IHW3_9MICO|nr:MULTISPECIES: recombinase family protein [Brevibacterium]RBP64265.1 resolvase-like protein [Brevibacterium sanguinis]RBP71443.1 resolvase-like protein [Brevibacterium celere]
MKTVLFRRSETENPTWLDDQEADCRRYAAEHDLTVTDTFFDIGRTGVGLDAVIDAADHDDVGVVIVTDLARLGSRITDQFAVVQRLHDAGVDIHVTKECATNGTYDSLLLGAMQVYAKVNHPKDG